MLDPWPTKDHAWWCSLVDDGWKALAVYRKSCLTFINLKTVQSTEFVVQMGIASYPPFNWNRNLLVKLCHPILKSDILIWLISSQVCQWWPGNWQKLKLCNLCDWLWNYEQWASVLYSAQWTMARLLHVDSNMSNITWSLTLKWKTSVSNPSLKLDASRHMTDVPTMLTYPSVSDCGSINFLDGLAADIVNFCTIDPCNEEVWITFGSK